MDGYDIVNICDDEPRLPNADDPYYVMNRNQIPGKVLLELFHSKDASPSLDARHHLKSLPRCRRKLILQTDCPPVLLPGIPLTNSGQSDQRRVAWGLYFIEGLNINIYGPIFLLVVVIGLVISIIIGVKTKKAELGVAVFGAILALFVPAYFGLKGCIRVVTN